MGLLSNIPRGLRNEDRAIIVATLSYFIAQRVLLIKGGTAPSMTEVMSHLWPGTFIGKHTQDYLLMVADKHPLELQKIADHHNAVLMSDWSRHQ